MQTAGLKPAGGEESQGNAEVLFVENNIADAQLFLQYLVTGAKPAFGEKNGSFERDKEDEQKARRRGPEPR